MKNLLLFLLGFISLNLNSQTFSAIGDTIPDDGSTSRDFNINVSGLQNTTNANFGISTVCFTIQHTYDSDLNCWLISPSGISVPLFQTIGGDGDNFISTCLNMTASLPIQSQIAPFTGTYLPIGNIGNLNNGSDPNGNWKLRIYDNYPQDQGVLIDWNITFDTNPPLPSLPFTSSELAIIQINTNNQVINDEPKINANLKIYWENGQAINTTSQTEKFNGPIGIEVRGSSSQMFPKKSYGFETQDVVGNSIDTALNYFPRESDWILSANYTDKSFMNNVLAYHLSNQFGHYAPRTQFVELVIDNNYQGVYVFMEKLKRDKNRINISKLTNTDISGDNLTGGYIVKIDKTTGSAGSSSFQSNFAPYNNGNGETINFLYDYPSDLNILPVQQDYIKLYIDTFENALFNGQTNIINGGWRNYASENSFIDYLIMNEISKNVDGYRISTYLHKDKKSKGGKLKAGPVWDYDIAFGNADYCNGNTTDGWAYEFNDICGGPWLVPFWWKKLMTEDTIFQHNLGCRYRELRSTFLDTTYLFNYIDSTSNYMLNAVNRNFATWQILGTYIWPNPSPIPATYLEEINELKNWLRNRLSWLDNHMPNQCLDLSVQQLEELEFSIYPNPIQNQFILSSEFPIEQLILTNSLGEKIELNYKLENKAVHFDCSNLVTGMYYLSFQSKSKLYTKKISVIK